MRRKAVSALAPGAQFALGHPPIWMAFPSETRPRLQQRKLQLTNSGTAGAEWNPSSGELMLSAPCFPEKFTFFLPSLLLAANSLKLAAGELDLHAPEQWP